MSGETSTQWYLNGLPKGLIRIDTEESEGRKRFNLIGIYVFMMQEDLGWYYSLEEVIARLGYTPTPLADLGDYPLHGWFDPDEERLEVAPVEFQGSTPILAKDVPVGSYLYRDADLFFKIFKGRDAVNDLGVLLT